MNSKKLDVLLKSINSYETALFDVIDDKSRFTPKTNKELREAVNYWCENPENRTTKYSHISNWNTINITDMSRLFTCICKINSIHPVHPPERCKCMKTYFNEPLTGWNTENVISFAGMFGHCSEFNQPLNHFDMSSALDISAMFLGCKKFNQDISNWDVSETAYMNFTFASCQSFNKSLMNWNVKSCGSFSALFMNSGIASAQHKYPKLFQSQNDDELTGKYYSW